ncbi:MAG: hypothetical protein WAL03_13190 [Pseudolabrys sp.]
MTRYGPEYAVRLCRIIGHRQPLIERLRDPAVRRTPHEMEYLAEVLDKPNHKWPTPGQVTRRREKLRRAAYYLEFLWMDGEDGKKMAAQVYAARKCRVDVSTVRKSLPYARRLEGGAWWKDTARLARKRKSESLHLTY